MSAAPDKAPVIEAELPPVDAVTAPWWDATREGVLLIQLCQACGRFQHYPRALCTGCGGTDLGWEQVAQYGVVDSFTVVHRGLPGFPAPYVVARVRLPLPNRIHLLTNLVDADGNTPADLDAIRCDQTVELSWRPLSDGRQLPVFTIGGNP